MKRLLGTIVGEVDCDSEELVSLARRRFVLRVAVLLAVFSSVMSVSVSAASGARFKRSAGPNSRCCG